MLLLIRLPHLHEFILRQGKSGRCPHGPQAQVRLQGRASGGEFMTSIAKIYPEAMNAAIADVVASFVQATFSLPNVGEAMSEELSQLMTLDFVSKTVVQPD